MTTLYFDAVVEDRSKDFFTFIQIGSGHTVIYPHQILKLHKLLELDLEENSLSLGVISFFFEMIMLGIPNIKVT